MRGDLMWTCLVWAERSTPDNFWAPSPRFNSATGEQKGITQTIYTDSDPPSRMPNSVMPSAKLRSELYNGESIVTVLTVIPLTLTCTCMSKDHCCSSDVYTHVAVTSTHMQRSHKHSGDNRMYIHITTENEHSNTNPK